MSLLDFHHQFVKYGEFHSNKVNQAIHMVFVPAIMWSCQVWLTSTPVVASWKFGHLLPINSAFIGTGMYCAYYFALHKRLGVLVAPVLLGMLYSANVFHGLKELPFGLGPNQAATIVHITSWIFQILGHQVFEGRAPAFTKDPIQALVLAPYFVFCEFLFKFGFFTDLAKELNRDIDIKAAAYRKSLKKDQ
jgi:2-hydroxy fatty acid dioxygenase